MTPIHTDLRVEKGFGFFLVIGRRFPKSIHEEHTQTSSKKATEYTEIVATFPLCTLWLEFHLQEVSLTFIYSDHLCLPIVLNYTCGVV